VSSGASDRFGGMIAAIVRFGIHNSSWLDAPDLADAFEAVKATAQWAEDHGFVWLSVMDQMIQIPGPVRGFLGTVIDTPHLPDER
jgi:hypothetical protein